MRVSGDFSQMAEVLLSAQPLEIEGVFVSALPRRSSRDLDGMVRRMNSGFGSFLTREVLERRPMARLFDFLREIPGVRVDQRGFDATMVVRGQRCSPHVYVDGVPFPIWDENTFVSQDLEAIEVYVGYAGIPAERIALDPGIGFGKTLGHNLAVLAATPELVALGYPLLVGVSRKSMFGQLLGLPVEARDPASAVTAALRSPTFGRASCAAVSDRVGTTPLA